MEGLEMANPEKLMRKSGDEKSCGYKSQKNPQKNPEMEGFGMANPEKVMRKSGDEKSCGCKI